MLQVKYILCSIFIWYILGWYGENLVFCRGGLIYVYKTVNIFEYSYFSIKQNEKSIFSISLRQTPNKNNLI